MNNYEECHQLLLNNFARLEILSSTIKNGALREHERLIANQKILVEQGHENDLVSMHNMAYYQISTGAPVFYDFKKQNTQELSADLITYRNKQYQWVLVEAYECFEDFIKATYAYIGSKNPARLTTKERSGEPNESLAAKPFSWFLELVRSNQNSGLTERLKVIRKCSPMFAVLETRNHQDIDFRSYITLISLLRHIIVHNGGRIKDEVKFFKELNEKVQQNRSGTYDPSIENEAKFFLFKDSNGVKVNLLETAAEKGKPFYIDRLGELLGILLTYSACIYEQISALHKSTDNTNAS